VRSSITMGAMLRRSLLTTLLGILVVLEGCGQRSSAAALPAAAVVPHDQWADQQDHELARIIRADLERDTLIGPDANLVSIAVAQGTVTLTGAVASVAMKAQAGVRARWLAGLDRVENALTVQPASESIPDTP
jgi:osmotically-inducible protein OsmY